MKKKLIMMILLVGLSSVMTVSHASDRIEDVSGGKNLLNLNHIYTVGNPNYGRDYTHMIAVEHSSTYTIVVDYDYFNSQLEDLMEFEYEYYPSGEPFSYLWQNDVTNQRVYVEFVPLDDYINIVAVPVPQGNSAINYNIMLYKGDYASFEGFEPYVNEGYEFELYGRLDINYDQMMTLPQIANLIIAKDADGAVIDKTVVSDTFSPSDQLPGEYEIVFQTTSNQLTRSYILGITVYDQTAPIIAGPDALTFEYATRPNVSDITNQLSVSDNVDDLAASDINIVLNTYNGASGLGEYQVKYEVTDSSGNIGYKTIFVTLVDTTPPEIMGPTDLYIYTTDTPYNEQELLSFFTANDAIDGNCYMELIENNYLSTAVSGIYHFTISTSDLNYNEATRIVYIHVIDNRGPSFVTDELIIATTASEQLSMNDVISDFIVHMAQSNIHVEDVEISYSQYEDHEDVEGDYYVYLSYKVNGITETSRVLITVADDAPMFAPIYWLGIVPIIGIGVLIFVKKRRS